MEAIQIQQDLSEYHKAINVTGIKDFPEDYLRPRYDTRIIQVIKNIEMRGDFPYNSTVEDEALRDYPEFKKYDKSKLSYLVYCSQSVKRSAETKIAVDEYINKTKDLLILEEIMHLKNEKKYFTVHAFGREPMKARLLEDAEGTLFFMKPRYKRKGYQVKSFYKPRIQL